MDYIHPKKRYSQAKTRKEDHSVDLATVAEEFGFDINKLKISKLSGGFMNANYLLKGNRQAVLRVIATNEESARREAALVELAYQNEIKVPKFYDLKVFKGKAYVLYEYMPGITLEDFLLTRKEVSKKTFLDLGSELGKIHSISFASNGFFNEQLKIAEPISDIDKFGIDYMNRVIPNIPDERLSKEIKERLHKLIQDKWEFVSQSSISNRLTHFDFNPKNILVSEDGELKAILDWEFGMAANCIADLGNFLRFTYDYPDFSKDTFIQGYERVLNLPEGWEDASRLLDLISMCGFLERKENYPETFKTAKMIVENTLDYFKY